MQLFDTHCHYNLDPLRENWQEHWRLAKKNAITHSIVVGTDAQTSRHALEIAHQESNLFASVGYHPNYFQEHIEQFVSEQTGIDANCQTYLDTIKKTLQTFVTKKPVAIGEVGLDFFRLRSKGLKRNVLIDLQKESLKIHLSVAHKHDLPVILHVRDQEGRLSESAYQQVLPLLEENEPKKFVLHCASGPIGYIQKAVEMGAYVGFDGNITYASAQHLRDIFAITPQDRILLETDAPYLAPEIHRDSVCEPWMITETAHFLRDVLKADLAQIYQNSFLFFNINKFTIQ